MKDIALTELNNKGIVTIDTLLIPKNIDAEIRNNELLANIFAKVIENNSYFSEIPVKHKDKKTQKYITEIKKWINISGWSFIDRVLKITPHIIKIDRKLVKKGKQEIIQHCSTCELRTLKGQVIATGIGKASSNEKFKDGWSESKLESLSQSRSISKTHRLYFQDILETLNLNNDMIIDADFVEKSPLNDCYTNAEKAVSKPSFDHPGNPELAEEIRNKKDKLNEEKAKKDKEKSSPKNSNKEAKITGEKISEPISDKEKTATEKAIEDKEKRDKEKEESENGFKTANKVETPPKDAEVLSHIKAIIVSLNEDEKEINETNIKLHLTERLRAKAITEEQCDEVVDKLAKMSIEELTNL